MELELEVKKLETRDTKASCAENMFGCSQAMCIE